MRLAFETLAEMGIRCELRRQHFDRDSTVETGVAGAIHLAHTTRAGGREHFVRPEPIPALSAISLVPPSTQDEA